MTDFHVYFHLQCYSFNYFPCWELGFKYLPSPTSIDTSTVLGTAACSRCPQTINVLAPKGRTFIYLRRQNSRILICDDISSRSHSKRLTFPANTLTRKQDDKSLSFSMSRIDQRRTKNKIKMSYITSGYFLILSHSGSRDFRVSEQLKKEGIPSSDGRALRSTIVSL